MENNYETYANTTCKDIPIEYLKQFILTFLYDASQDMGQVFDKDITPERVYNMISTHYHHLPLCLVASGFKRGALGQYGPGKLVPRTIFGWLSEINQYYCTVHEKKDEEDYNHHKFDGLEKYPMGKSIIKKIDWYEAGLLTDENWGKVSLKELAKAIGEGRFIQFNDFI
jgi:hypothetical protein